MVAEAGVKRLQMMKRQLAGAARASQRRGDPFSRKNLKTLFQSAIGTFPRRPHRKRKIYERDLSSHTCSEAKKALKAIKKS